MFKKSKGITKNEKEGEVVTEIKKLSSRDSSTKLLSKIILKNKCTEEKKSYLLEICAEIEGAVWERAGNITGLKYNNMIRDIYFSLIENKELLSKLKEGEISPVEIGNMSVQELATKERREEDEILKLEGLFQRIISKASATETDQFRCGKCGERKTTYYQLQTRSADEPMTTFVACISCGYKWKFC
eukprot:GHVP01031452.1.p1 GENE.GHVP01031452.1~~GHVP01031452.1.p1  ORF type:complete len:187 (+),score=38.74 GHVP01031452.1:85-645(+)